MKNEFVETANVQRFQAALTALERRGAQEACLMVVDGLPGLGKTTALHRWASQNGSIFVRAKKEWTPSGFLNDLLSQFGIAPAHSYQKRYAQALEVMLQRQSVMTRSHKTFAVVIDEADHISRSGRIMESIRDFSDMGDIVFVLVGMGKIRDNLTGFPQVASRIAQYVRFDHATEADVRKFYDVICEVPVSDDLVRFTHSVTQGYNREIKEALATVERFGKRNGATSGKPVTLAHLSGQPLVNDRRSGTPIIVPQQVL
jgi:DNA transposition AAA+ family ATPase